MNAARVLKFLVSLVVGNNDMREEIVPRITAGNRSYFCIM